MPFYLFLVHSSFRQARKTGKLGDGRQKTVLHNSTHLPDRVQVETCRLFWGDFLTSLRIGNGVQMYWGLKTFCPKPSLLTWLLDVDQAMTIYVPNVTFRHMFPFWLRHVG
jgi:hypothetical protein